MMFEVGDKVVHTRHGAGVVKESRTITYNGKTRDYFVIQMNEARHTLMIPYDSIDEDELRLAMDDTSIIEKVMAKQPGELDDNYRVRQAKINKLLRTRSPRLLAEALRDMSWLEYTHKLTNTDMRLREQLVRALTREMALMPNYTLPQARTELQQIIANAMQRHATESGAQAASIG